MTTDAPRERLVTTMTRPALSLLRRLACEMETDRGRALEALVWAEAARRGLAPAQATGAGELPREPG